jgi:hypothetical protein
MRCPTLEHLTPSRHHRTRAVGVAVACAAIAVSVIPAAAVAALPQDPYVVAVLFPPWWSEDRADAAADTAGVVGRRGRWTALRVVYGGDDLIDRLRASGALLILDAGMARCEPRPEGRL